MLSSFIPHRSSLRNWLWRKDSNLRMAALTVRCLTNLATPQKDCFEFGVSSSFRRRRNSKHQTPNLKLTIGCGDESRTRIISFTRRALCYPIELRRNGGLGGIQTLTRSLQDFYALGYITSPRKFRVLCFEFRVRDALVLELETRNSKLIVGGCGWSRTTNLALMRRLLCST